MAINREISYPFSRNSSDFLSAILIGSLLLIIQIVPKNPLLIFERIAPNMGYLQIILLSLYGMFVHNKLSSSKHSTWRKRFWLIFSIFFYVQLLLGLTVSSIFLMTGKLHIPLPPLILAGPIYRMTFSVMIPIFLASILITGPAWCSYLCYFGVFDSIASSKKIGGYTFIYNFKHILIRLSSAVIFIIIPLLLHNYKASINSALVISFFVFAIEFLIIFLFSLKKGGMYHCTSFCPIGFFANVLGKLSTFRIKISKHCKMCQKCISKCAYGALDIDQLKKGTPKLSCSLCGDCTFSCRHGYIQYSFLSLSKEASREIFITIITVMHVIFLAIAKV